MLLIDVVHCSPSCDLGIVDFRNKADKDRLLEQIRQVFIDPDRIRSNRCAVEEVHQGFGECQM